jgi:hypothetical protein
MMAFARSGWIRNPDPLTINPRHETSFASNIHLSILTLMLLCPSNWNALGNPINDAF